MHFFISACKAKYMHVQLKLLSLPDKCSFTNHKEESVAAHLRSARPRVRDGQATSEDSEIQSIR